MSGSRTFRICGRRITIPETPKLPDMKWDDLVQPSPVQKRRDIPWEIFDPEEKKRGKKRKKVVRRKRAKGPN
jgi:hypothetical protein